MYKLIPGFLLIGLLVGCSTNNFVGKASNSYEKFSCTLEEKVCRINYVDSGYVEYFVEETSPNTYRVKGNVDLYMQVVGGMHSKISFFVLFMDDEKVLFERKVRTGTRKATFEFEVETENPIIKTTIQNMKYHTWS